MARARRKKQIGLEPVFDATEERLTKGDESEWINPALLNSHLPSTLVRRFRSAHLDRFYKRDNPDRSLLTWRQWYAGDWYRSQHARSGFTLSVIASYGERVSSGGPSYGLARTEAQAHARDLWRKARQQFPQNMVGFMDRFLIHDELPRYSGGWSRDRDTRAIAAALDGLADWLKLGKERAA